MARRICEGSSHLEGTGHGLPSLPMAGVALPARSLLSGKIVVAPSMSRKRVCARLFGSTATPRPRSPGFFGPTSLRRSL